MNAKDPHDLLGSAFLLVTTIRGGGYIAVPGECSFSLIGKLLPGASIDEACDELEEVVRGAIDDPDVEVTLSYPAGRDHPLGGSPVEIDRNHDAVRTLAEILNAARPDGAVSKEPRTGPRFRSSSRKSAARPCTAHRGTFATAIPSKNASRSRSTTPESSPSPPSSPSFASGRPLSALRLHSHLAKTEDHRMSMQVISAKGLPAAAMLAAAIGFAGPPAGAQTVGPQGGEARPRRSPSPSRTKGPRSSWRATTRPPCCGTTSRTS